MSIKRNQKTVTLRCECIGQCAMLVIDKDIYDDNEIGYHISMQDSSYNHNYNTIWGRLKRACKALLGKRIYYNDICVDNPQNFINFVGELNELIGN